MGRRGQRNGRSPIVGRESSSERLRLNRFRLRYPDSKYPRHPPILTGAPAPKIGPASAALLLLGSNVPPPLRPMVKPDKSCSVGGAPDRDRRRSVVVAGTATFPSYGSTIFEGQIFVHAAGGGLTIDAQSTFGTDSPGFYGIKLIPAPV